jgi:hypothetical protein
MAVGSTNRCHLRADRYPERIVAAAECTVYGDGGNILLCTYFVPLARNEEGRCKFLSRNFCNQCKNPKARCAAAKRLISALRAKYIRCAEKKKKTKRSR